MIVALDFGNSFVKIASFKNGDIITEVQLANTNINDKLWTTVNALNPTTILVSSVTKETIDLLKNVEIFSFNSTTPLPIKLDYSTPKTLGQDRICNAVACWTKHQNQNSLAIDIGTCITYDFVTSEGEYLGGAIAPGQKLRFKSLNDYTAKLPLINLQENVDLIGKTTNESILSGVIFGIINEINETINRYKEQYNDLNVVLTGGDHIYFAKALKNITFADPHLVLKGLHAIYQHNN